MSNSEPTLRSAFMEWAKARSHARFNLATSGVLGVPGGEFPFPPAGTTLEITKPHDGYGYSPLQERLARHTGAPAECVVAAAGTSMANHLAMAALVRPGDEVLIEQPTYGPLLDVAAYLGAVVRRFLRRPETGFAVEPDAVAAAVTSRTRLIVLCNLHNPTGALVPTETLRALGEIAQRVGARVLVDEVYLEMLVADSARPHAFSIGESFADARFVVTSSLTKAYGLSGLRCGWVLAAPDLARSMWRLHDLFEASAAHPAEQLSVLALDGLAQFRERACSLLRTNRALLDAFLDSRSDLECFRPMAGTVVFPRLPEHAEPAAFFEMLRENYETSVVPGKFFEMPGHFRIGIGGDTANLRAGLERLGAALDRV